MPTRFTEVHISSPVSSVSLRAKDHLEGTKVAVSPRYCAEQEVQTRSAAAGGHRGVATRETTGDLAARRGAGDPETRAEWMKVLRYGHLWSAPVVVDVGVRTEWEPPTLRAALWLSTRPTWAPPRWLTASPTTRDCVCRVLALQDIAMCSQFRSRSSSETQVPEVMGPEGRERHRSTALVSCPQRLP